MELANNLGLYMDVKKASKIFFIIFTVYFSIINTKNYFGYENPSLNCSFGMKKIGLFEIDNLKLKVRLDVIYYNISSEEYNTQSFFEKTK